MSNIPQPSQADIANIRKALADNKINMKELDKLLAAGANPEIVAELRKNYEESNAKMEQFLKIYGE